MLKRWVVLCDGEEVGFEFSEKKAWFLAYKHEHEMLEHWSEYSTHRPSFHMQVVEESIE